MAWDHGGDWETIEGVEQRSGLAWALFGSGEVWAFMVAESRNGQRSFTTGKKRASLPGLVKEYAGETEKMAEVWRQMIWNREEKLDFQMVSPMFEADLGKWAKR